MFRSAKPVRQPLAAENPAAPESPANPNANEPDSRDASALAQSAQSQQMLESLRGQPGFGVVFTASETSPASSPQGISPQNLGNRLDLELDAAISREKQVLELMDLASRPARNLTSDQLRRLLELMA